MEQNSNEIPLSTLISVTNDNLPSFWPKYEIANETNGSRDDERHKLTARSKSHRTNSHNSIRHDVFRILECMPDKQQPMAIKAITYTVCMVGHLETMFLQLWLGEYYSASISSAVRPVTCEINAVSEPSSFIFRAFSILVLRTSSAVSSKSSAIDCHSSQSVSVR